MKILLFFSLIVVVPLVLVYPRPFRTADLHEISPSNLGITKEFSDVGLLSGCKVEVWVSLEQSWVTGVGEIATSLRFQPPVEQNFSPWLKRLPDQIHETSYFASLDFSECYVALANSYSGMDVNKALRGEVDEVQFRIGRTDAPNVPLSYSNSVIMLVRSENIIRLVLIKGGT